MLPASPPHVKCNSTPWLSVEASPMWHWCSRHWVKTGCLYWNSNRERLVNSLKNEDGVFGDVDVLPYARAERILI